MTTTVLLGFASGLITILLSLVAYIGNGMVKQLEKIAGSVSRIENDLSVLSNDHNNLKEDVKELKQKITRMSN